jgi:hypothetical protein
VTELPEDERAANLRAEYGVIGAYVTSLTSSRFQTVAIYLAAVGLLVGRAHPSRAIALLLLLLSVALWLLELRNRDVLARHGERGIAIETQAWLGGAAGTGGAGGFFIDGAREPRLFLLGRRGLLVPPRLACVVSHAFAIDLLFLSVIGYCIVVLGKWERWPLALIALCAPVAGVVLALARRDADEGAADAAGQATTGRS